jgi:signal transduction histidine kinase
VRRLGGGGEEWRQGLILGRLGTGRKLDGLPGTGLPGIGAPGSGTDVTARPPLPLSARFLLAVIVAGGAGALALHAPAVAQWNGADVAAWAGLALAIFVAEQFPIPLRHQGETQNLSLDDAIWAAALLLAPPSVFIMGTVAGIAGGQLARRWAPHKIVFNVGDHVIGLSLALAVVAAFGRLDPLQPEAWVAATLAMAVHFAVNETLVAAAITLVSGERFKAVLRPSLTLSAVQWVGSVAVGILGAVLWMEHPLATPMLAAPILLSYLASRAWLRNLEERQRIVEMGRIAETISSQGDLTMRIAERDTRDEVGLLAATFNGMLDRLEAAFEKEQRFIGEVSHELRTPITICRGYLDVLGPNPAADAVREAIDVVVDELSRMSRIVEDMTTLARTDEPDFVRPEVLPLDRFMTVVAAKAAPLLNGRLRMEALPVGAMLRADPHRLTQALINLLSNAALHTTNGCPITVRVVEEETFWRFDVEDQGGGLVGGQEEDLFRPFSRGPTTALGNGLGLAIVRRVAEAHGGSAGVANRPGEGATFWIRVPR